MLLSEIFDALTYGELAHIDIGGKPLGGIQSADYPEMVTNVNMALLELYKRFSIKTGELTLQLEDHISTYYLTSEYALSNDASSQPYKYILDVATATEFTDDILLITHVYDEVGDEYALNDLDRVDSLYTPTQTSLQVPYPSSENAISVIYRVTPEIILKTITDPAAETVELPYQYMEALTAYVAYRVFSGMNLGAEDTTAMNHYGKFEAAVALIDHKGLAQPDNNQNTKFEESGWV